jgi:hypothetical protein
MKKPAIGLALASVFLLTGCMTSYQARDVKPSGFLGDSASLLKAGEKGKGDLLVFRKERADWASYDKVIVDPVAIWDVKTAVPPEELADFQRLLDSFYVTLREKLAKSYRLVDDPTPGALRIQAAIINGRHANAPLKIAKTVAPYAAYADVLWTFATGKPAFAGEVTIEYTIKDSQSGELLAAGADRRVGGNQLGKSTLTRWGDVQNILVYWSDTIVYRLCLDRAATDCVEPKAGILKNPAM